MPRLLFEKKGNAVWISHLDLMRLFQRAFKRAGLPLKHTQGFNPRPSVSIALPLSVGVESICELLDFDLDCEFDKWDQLAEMLNSALVDGVTVRQVYQNGRKIRDLSLMRSVVTLEYDGGVTEDITQGILALFSRESLTVEKKTKNGIQQQDIIPMIRAISVQPEGDRQLKLEVLHCCQNPTLNPMQLPVAVERYLPAYKPNFSKCSRVEIYDCNEVVFR